MASLAEPIQGGPYPAPDDSADIPNDMKSIVDWAASRSVMRFTSTGDREAKLPAPTEGMLCVTGTGTALALWLYRNGAWLDVLGASSNTIRIGGVDYQKSGVFPTGLSLEFTYADGVGYATGNLPRPYAPPAGWGFVPHIISSARYNAVSFTSPTASPLALRVIQVGSGSPGNLRLGWTLRPIP